jgi:hypothetical protein
MQELTEIVSEGWNTFQNFQGNYPLLGSLLVSQVTYPIADVVSQLIKDKKVKWKQVGFTAGLAPMYGATVYGLMESGELVGKTISDDPLAKAVLGPNLWGNIANSMFFVNNTVGEKVNYSLKKLAKHYLNLFSNKKINLRRRQKKNSCWQNFKDNYISNIPKKQYLNATIATFTGWNVFQYCNYAYVPENMRTPLVLAAGMAWVSLLSLWSLKGRRNITNYNNHKNS